ncbi:hypothetical protein BH24ACT20_BH24ACT20_05200 [soil metagenome]
MPEMNLGRLGGVAGAVGGVLWCLRVALDGFGGDPAAFAGRLLFVVPLLFCAGLAGFYVLYSARMRGEGRAGFVQSFVGLGFLAAGFFADLTLGIEEGVRISSFGFIILTLGLVVLGFATLKTEPLYMWNFLPLAIGMLTLLNVIAGAYDLLRILISAIFGLGWLAWGILILVDPRETGENIPVK